MIGKISNVSIVAVIKPPIITIANGFEDSDPIPVERAAGIKPIEAIKAVMMMGRVLTFTACKIESSSVKSAFRFLWYSEINKTPF